MGCIACRCSTRCRGGELITPYGLSGARDCDQRNPVFSLLALCMEKRDRRETCQKRAQLAGDESF